MPLITQVRQPYTHTAGPIVLSGADFLSRLRAVYRLVEGTTTFESFQPGSQFPAFTTLETGKTYIVDSQPQMLPYTIPDGIQLPDSGAADGASASLSTLRALQQVPTNSRFYTTDTGKEGSWFVDATDSFTGDNGGTVLVNQASQRLKRTNPFRTVRVAWFDIFPDGTPCQTKLEKMLNDLGNGWTFLFDGGRYYFEALPLGVDQGDHLCGINLTDRQVSFVGQGNLNTTLAMAPGCVGISAIEAGQKTFNTLSDLTIAATGKAPLDGKNDDGSWAMGIGDRYKFNGINAWSQMHLHSVNITGFSGIGLCIFGGADLKIPGRAVSVVVRLVRDNNDLRIYSGDTQDIKRIFNGDVVFNGANYRVTGVGDTYVALGLIPGLAMDGTITTITVRFAAKGTIADCGLVDGVWEISACGGPGIFTVGADANQWNFKGMGTIRENGHWGVYEDSLLGNHYDGTHFTHNGINFLGVKPDGSLDDHSYTIGDIWANNGNGRSTFTGCYTEQGNGGPTLVNAFTKVDGGFHGKPVIGGSGQIDGAIRGVYSQEMIAPNGAHYILAAGNDGLLHLTPAP